MPQTAVSPYGNRDGGFKIAGDSLVVRGGLPSSSCTELADRILELVFDAAPWIGA